LSNFLDATFNATLIFWPVTVLLLQLTYPVTVGELIVHSLYAKCL